MSVELGLNIFQKLWVIIKSFFWKNTDIMYINSNVKIFNIKDAKYLVRSSNVKIINCQSKKSITLNDLRKHFLKSRLNLFQILRNLQESSLITYCGFCSSMFGVYDGFKIGNTFKFQLIDYNNKYYSINENLKYKDHFISIDDSKKEINIIISSSYDISKNKVQSVPTYSFDKKGPNKLNSTYLNEIYSFVRSILDSCCSTDVRKVNLYIAGKQSVNFIVGLAIQTYHPQVFVHEYRDNRFKFYMDLFNGKIMEE